MKLDVNRNRSDISSSRDKIDLTEHARSSDQLNIVRRQNLAAERDAKFHPVPGVFCHEKTRHNVSRLDGTFRLLRTGAQQRECGNDDSLRPVSEEEYI